MYLDKAKKEEIFGQYGKSTTDTGSAEAQIALFSYRISHLTEHLKKNHKDHNTARSLTMLVGKRRFVSNHKHLKASQIAGLFLNEKSKEQRTATILYTGRTLID